MQSVVVRPAVSAQHGRWSMGPCFLRGHHLRRVPSLSPIAGIRSPSACPPGRAFGASVRGWIRLERSLRRDVLQSVGSPTPMPQRALQVPCALRRRVHAGRKAHRMGTIRASRLGNDCLQYRSKTFPRPAPPACSLALFRNHTRRLPSDDANECDHRSKTALDPSRHMRLDDRPPKSDQDTTP